MVYLSLLLLFFFVSNYIHWEYDACIHIFSVTSYSAQTIPNHTHTSYWIDANQTNTMHPKHRVQSTAHPSLSCSNIAKPNVSYLRSKFNLAPKPHTIYLCAVFQIIYYLRSNWCWHFAHLKMAAFILFNFYFHPFCNFIFLFVFSILKNEQSFFFSIQRPFFFTYEHDTHEHSN